ncbi:MAG: hypothetical protein MUO76_17805 [Anaerolineaceae bacterium]|nr:hypothetical protein [Anaerolineaceae bacterium]
MSLYGPIAKHAGGKYVATVNLIFEKQARISDLLAKLNIANDEKGYLFIDSVLCDAPGLNASLSNELKDQCHVGIFSTTHMWPYQYRDGVHMSDSLKEAMEGKGTYRHSYREA